MTFFEIEMRGYRREVVGIVIHVVAVAGLGGPAVAAAVMGDDAIAVTEEEQHLIVPVVGRQRPTMAEHDGLTFAPVLVEDLDAVFGLHDAHGMPAFAAVAVARGNRNLSRPSAGWPHRAGSLARDDVIRARSGKVGTGFPKRSCFTKMLERNRFNPKRFRPSACAKRASRPKHRARNRSRRNKVSDRGAACRPCNRGRRQTACCPRCA